jgi:hypothetical protein
MRDQILKTLVSYFEGTDVDQKYGLKELADGIARTINTITQKANSL